LAYQWQFNGGDIAGATASGLSLSAITTNDLGLYRVIVSNAAGTATSSNAQLTFGPVAAWGRNSLNESLPPPNLANICGLAAVSGGSFALQTDGTITPWGAGSATNLGNFQFNPLTNIVAISSCVGTVMLRNTGYPATTILPGPYFITPSNVVAVAAGDNFGLTLRAEGTIDGWGGVGGALSYTNLLNLDHVTAIACGYNNSMALKIDGTVYATGTAPFTSVPAGLSNVVGIAAGYDHALALKANGTVTAWGTGNGTNVPVGLTNVAAIFANSFPQGYLRIAIRSNGTVVAWGDGSYGSTNPPTALTNLFSGTAAVSAGRGMALVSDGKPMLIRSPAGLTAFTGREVTLRGEAVGTPPLIYQWTRNGFSVPGATNPVLRFPSVQMGDAGSYRLIVNNALGSAASLPAPLTVLSGGVSFLRYPAPATNYQGNKVSLGVTVLGSGPVSLQWFYSPTNSGYSPIPNETNDTLTLDRALVSQSGYYYAAAMNSFSSNNTTPAYVRILFARAWGYQATNPPVNMTNAVAIATGNLGTAYGSYFALDADGKLISWANYNGSYGETNVAPLSNTVVKAVAGGFQQSVALRADGTVYAWGYNSYGETNVPGGLADVIAVSSGDYHNIALKSDGTVIAWGRNLYGEGTNSVAPTNAAVAIAAGSSHNLALRPDGTVFGWGNSSGSQIAIPSSATNVIAIAAGANHGVALRANGTVVQWGSSMVNYPVPPTLSNVVAISAGGTHSVAVRSDGSVIAWGSGTGFSSNNVPSDMANVIAVASSSDHDVALLGTRAPTFTIQPLTRNAFKGTNILIVGKVSGAQQMNYQWRFNGANIAGGTTDVLTLTNLQFSQAGVYQLIASNIYGVTASKAVKVAVTLPLGTALNATNLTWTSTGAAAWFGQTNTTHDGIDAAQSGGIGNSQESILQTTYTTNRAGAYTFWWKISSEAFFDFLEFRLDGVAQTSISGNVDWTLVRVPVTTGTHTLQWRYFKDSSNSDGQDAAWVDQFTFAAPPTFIFQPPSSRTVNAGASVGFTALVDGALPIAYQWRHNGNPTADGNNSTIILTNVGRIDNGSYSLVCSNIGGVSTSSVVTLKVLVPQLLGSPTLLADGTFSLASFDGNGALLTTSNLANFTPQASSNLIDWFALPGSLSVSNGVLQLQDSDATNSPMKFYRILENQ
jgi:alpha-tubulin suppressor-like RCC1 family protein